MLISKPLQEKLFWLFQIVAIVNNVTMNTGVASILSDGYFRILRVLFPQVGPLGQKAVPYLIF